MQTSLAQMVALTCHGNAVLRGIPVPQFFPGNSTCLFCEYVRFLVSGKPAGSQLPQLAVFADSPDAWLSLLASRGALGLRLRQRAQISPGIPDRSASAFVGGGRLWTIEVIRKGGVSELWRDRWEVGKRDAPDRKIWRVSYGLDLVEPTATVTLRALDMIAHDLRAALTDIRAFAEANECRHFTRCFDDALRALDDPAADIGYHKDLYPESALDPAAQSLLKGAQAGWVFGGMGSWNDLGFDGKSQNQYERFSDRLFDLLNEAVEAATTSSQHLHT
jgi:hypothetical protein